MTRYAIGLGSNLGDRLGHLRAAIEALAQLGDVPRVSALYETEPVGGPDQDPYLNAVVVLESPMTPRQLLDRLHRVEADRGRVRGERWGPRTLDLDIVAMSPGSVDEPGLVVPHPRASQRAFVLSPLAEVWPDASVGGGLTARDASSQVGRQEVDRLAGEWVREGGRGSYWLVAQGLIFLAIAVLLAVGAAASRPAWPWQVAGAALLITGVSLTISSARALGRSLRAVPEPRPGGALVEWGPYGRARHPIYGGIVLTFLGLSLLVGSPAAGAVSLGLVPFFWAKSEHEERMLRIAYPGYRAYADRVRRRLIPHIL